MSKSIRTVKHGLTALAVTALALGGSVGLGVGAANAMGSTGSLVSGHVPGTTDVMGSTGSLGHRTGAYVVPQLALPGLPGVPMAPILP